MQKKLETLEERIKYLNEIIPSEVLSSVADQYGKDAVVAHVLRSLRLDKRDNNIKCAEMIYNLVPGQIVRTIMTNSRTVVVPENMGEMFNDGYNEPEYNKEIELKKWFMRIICGYDEESGALFVYDANAE